MKKTVIVFSLLLITLLMQNVLAITGSIGNARMILRLETGEEMEKSVLVKNVNEIPVNIEVTASGDLENYTEVKDEAFRLGPGEEKKAYFTIKSLRAGTTETKINVAFSSVEEEGGVGLSSTVIVIAEGENKTEENKNTILSWLSKNDEEENEEENGESITGSSVIINNFNSINIVSLGLLSTTVILVIFIVLLVIYSQKKSRIKVEKRVRKK